MRKKSKNYSTKKKNVASSAKKSRTFAAEGVSPSSMKASLSVLPLENLSEISPEAPSTSQNTMPKTIALLKSNELIEINQKVNFLLDKCFQNKSEIVVNRRVLEDIVSDTLGHFYSQEDKFKNVTEAKYLTEKCKILQTEQIKLNRQRYALKKQVEDAKHIIKKMIDEKHLFNRGIIRRILPATMKRQVRSVGLQVCLVGPMFISKPVITYSTSITSQYTESILPPEEHRTARKRTVNKEVVVKKVNELSTSKISQSLNNRALQKENLCGIKLNSNTIRKISEESVSNVVPTKKANSAESKSNITNRRMSTRKTNIDEAEHSKPNSAVKVKSITELNKELKNMKQDGELPKVDNKIIENGISCVFKQVNEDIIIKEEVMDEGVYDVVEISEDEDTEETITETKEVIKAYDKKEAGTQFNVNNDIDKNFSFKSIEASSSQGAGPLIKVRSPEFINQHLIKSLNTSSATDRENISFCQLPKYPMSPKYPSDVSKPPAPILQVGKKSNVETQGIMLTWSFACKKPENIIEYQLFAYQERSGRNNSNDVWKKVGDIKALPLPMACYLSQFIEDETYHFIIRAVDSQKRLGDFSIPAGIKLQKLDPSLKTSGGTIFKVSSSQNKF